MLITAPRHNDAAFIDVRQTTLVWHEATKVSFKLLSDRSDKLKSCRSSVKSMAQTDRQPQQKVAAWRVASP